MHAKKKALLCAGLIAGTAALTGCSAGTKPISTPTPMVVQQQTAEPATAQPAPEVTVSVSEAPQESPAPMTLLIGGEKVNAGAIMEQDQLMLPLMETAEKLGWTAKSEQTEAETQTKHVVTLEKGDSRITVSWMVSDNTVKNISWQKDGLLIPVDTHIVLTDDTVYVPAAFFEMAVDARITKGGTNVIVSTPKPNDTPKTTEDSSGENG